MHSKGCGMMTSEQLTIHTDVGRLEAVGPINYKIPGIRNIPKDFRVSLLKEAAGGHKDLYSSKVWIITFYFILPFKVYYLKIMEYIMYVL